MEPKQSHQDNKQEQKPLPCVIKELQHEINAENIHTDEITCLIELTDKRIATCGVDKSISIISIDHATNTWKQDIKKEKAHSNTVYSLCELNNNRLISGSSKIKVWSITPNDLILLSTLTNHTDYICKVIPLTNNRFCSCSGDKTLKLWNSESPYEVITTSKHEKTVRALLQLKQKEILITSTGKISIDFWDLNNYKKLNSIKGHYTCYDGMIELPNGLVAISSEASGCPIIIVNPDTYSVIKEIKEEEYIVNSSTLCMLDKYSFIYVCEGNVIQIAVDDEFNVLYKSKEEEKEEKEEEEEEEELGGYNGLVSVNGGEYLIVGTECGFKVVKPYYE